MRIFTSLSSMVLLSLTALSLTSCGQSDKTDSSTLSTIPKISKVTPKTVASCSNILKLGSISVKMYPAGNVVSGKISKIKKDVKGNKTFELNIVNLNGNSMTLNGHTNGANTVVEGYALAECYSTKTMSLTSSPCSSAIKNGDITWSVEQGTYKKTGKGAILNRNVDRLTGNMTFEFFMNNSQPGSDTSNTNVYIGKTEGEKVSYVLDGDNSVSFSGSCVENTVTANYNNLKHTLTK